MTANLNAKLGFKMPLDPAQLQAQEFDENDIEKGLEKAFPASQQEDQPDPLNSSIGTQENPKNFGPDVLSDGQSMKTPGVMKARLSFFYQEAAVYFREREELNSYLPDANIHPAILLKIDTITFSIYQIVRGALVNDKTRLKEMDERIRNMSEGCQAIGRWIVAYDGDDTAILRDKNGAKWYFNFLNYTKNTISLLFELINQTNLGLHFEEEKEWKKVIKGKRGDLTHKISDKEAKQDEEIQRRAVELARKMTDGKARIEPEKQGAKPFGGVKDVAQD